MSERSNEMPLDGSRSPEAAKSISELEREHAALEVEWSLAQQQVLGAYQSLVEALAGRFYEGSNLEKISDLLQRWHTRQGEIIDRQLTIEQDLITRLR
jgi:hypothetical protein